MKKISICVPTYNEEENIEAMYNALIEQMKVLDEYDYEIVFTDNASTDSSAEILRKLAKKDTKVKVIINNRNFGPTRSGINCINRTTGDAVITIPCDFQEPPEMIPIFIRAWEEGNLVVLGQKIESDENKLMYTIRSLYYFICSKFSELPPYRHVTGFGLTDRTVIDEIKKYEDNYRGLKPHIVEMGYDVKLIPYKQNRRQGGSSSYTLSSYFSLAINILLSSSGKPIRLVLNSGIFSMVTSFFCCIIYVIASLLNAISFNIEVLLLFLVLFIMSFVLFAVGLIGEYLNQILNRVIKKPLVVERELINFNINEKISEE